MLMSAQTCSLSIVKDRLEETEEREKSVPSVEREKKKLIVPLTVYRKRRHSRGGAGGGGGAF